MLNEEEFKNYKKAGQITANAVNFARKLVKPEVPLLEIAEKTEEKICQLGGKPAFPVDVSCNEIAAHYSPSWNDKSIAKGLVKVDIGVAVDGYIVDTAFSLDLSPEEKYKEMINAAENALAEAIKIAKHDIAVNEIGKRIQQIITQAGFSPIKNLSGHELAQYRLHAGLTIPNYDNNNPTKLKETAYAIEPFATSGLGLVQEGSPSGVYEFKMKKPVRDKATRAVLDFIEQRYKTLPFATRWLVKKFGTRSLLSLNLLEQAGCVYQFPQLNEKSHAAVSQAEDSILIIKDKTISLTKDIG
jgi:methionyl aminopeptidase